MEAGPGGAARSDEHPGDAGVRSGKKPVGRNGGAASGQCRCPGSRLVQGQGAAAPRPGGGARGAAGGSPGERALQEQRRSGLNTETSN